MDPRCSDLRRNVVKYDIFCSNGVRIINKVITLAGKNVLTSVAKFKPVFPLIMEGYWMKRAGKRLKKRSEFNYNIGSREQRANGKPGRIRIPNGSSGKQNDGDDEMKY